MKKILVFLMALAFLMLIAIPATAGPAAALPTIGSVMLPALTPAAKASMPAETVASFSSFSPPIIARTLSAPLASFISAIKPNYRFAVLAMLAGLMCSSISMVAVEKHVRYDPRDRMHGLPRDQDSLA